MKKCSENQKEFNFRLLEWRNTPNDSGRSPAQMFLGRRVRGKLPTLHGATSLNLENAIAGGNTRREILASMEKNPKRKLSLLHVGQRVTVQNTTTKNWDEKATVLEIKPNKRSYIIKEDNGRVWIRNRRYLRVLHLPNTNDPFPNPTPPPAKTSPLRRSSRLKSKAK